MNDDHARLEERARELAAEAASHELPVARTCLDLAKVSLRLGRPADAVRWSFAACDAGEELVDWMAAASLVRRCLPDLPSLPRRARVAVLGSYTTSQLAALLPVAAARAGVEVEVYEAGYGQYRREVLDPGSGLYAFGPDVVVLAVHAGEIDLPALSVDPEADLERELMRWTSLWDVLRARCGARVVQHNVVWPAEESRSVTSRPGYRGPRGRSDAGSTAGWGRPRGTTS